MRGVILVLKLDDHAAHLARPEVKLQPRVLWLDLDDRIHQAEEPARVADHGDLVLVALSHLWWKRPRARWCERM